MKELSKSIVKSIGYYDPFHRIWEKRPDPHYIILNVGYRLLGAPDKLPIPPDYLIYKTIISREVAWYLLSGNICFRCLLSTIEELNINAHKFESVLDFGCGCGRVIRNWKTFSGPNMYGSDCDRDLIGWCKKRLTNVAHFFNNKLDPPLIYPNNFFDFSYAISVFTHMTEQGQDKWLAELARVTKPGKYILLSLHGESRLSELNPEEKQQFGAGQLVVKNIGIEGSNPFGAYHPYRYVVDHFSNELELKRFIPQGEQDSNQDIYLFQKRG